MSTSALGLRPTYKVKSGVDGNTLMGLVVKHEAAADGTVEGATVKTAKTVNDFPAGIVAEAEKNYVGVCSSGLVDAYFGAAYDPAADGKLLTFDGNSKLIAAVAGDMAVADYYSGGEVTAADITAGGLATVRKVRVLGTPFIIPA